MKPFWGSIQGHRGAATRLGTSEFRAVIGTRREGALTVYMAGDPVNCVIQRTPHIGNGPPHTTVYNGPLAALTALHSNEAMSEAALGVVRAWNGQGDIAAAIETLKAALNAKA